MAESGEGVPEEHSGTAIAHNGGDGPSMGRGIAVDGAAAAGGLRLAVGAVRKAGMGVGEQVGTFGADLRFAAVLATAIEPNHFSYDALFEVNFAHKGLIIRGLRVINDGVIRGLSVFRGINQMDSRVLSGICGICGICGIGEL